MIPLNDLKRLYVQQAPALEAAGLEVMRSGWWLNGGKNKEFCEAFRNFVGTQHCVGVANGTDALELSFRALLNQSRNQHTARNEVVTAANAGGYTTVSAYNAGCVPVYVDVDPASMLIDLQGAIAALTDTTLCVVVTHLYGGLVDVAALRRQMDATGYSHVAIIEDCAQAHGAQGRGGHAGALGTLGTFSFYPTKNLGALGDGGAITTNNEELATTLRKLQMYGWDTKYHVTQPRGRNSRLDEIQAAFLLTLLPHIGDWNLKRQQALAAYKAAAPDGVRLIESPIDNVGHLAVVHTKNRDSLRAHMRAHDISTDIHFPVLDCDQEGWAYLPQRIGPLGVDKSREAVQRIVSLPCFSTITDDEIKRVATALAAFDASE